MSLTISREEECWLKLSLVKTLDMPVLLAAIRRVGDVGDFFELSFANLVDVVGLEAARELQMIKTSSEVERWSGICQASFPEISQKNRYQLSSSRDVVPDPRIFVYQSRSIDRPRNVLSCSHGTGRDPDDRYHSRSPRIRAGRSFLIHLLLFNRFRWLLRI